MIRFSLLLLLSRVKNAVRRGTRPVLRFVSERNTVLIQHVDTPCAAVGRFALRRHAAGRAHSTDTACVRAPSLLLVGWVLRGGGIDVAVRRGNPWNVPSPSLALHECRIGSPPSLHLAQTRYNAPFIADGPLSRSQRVRAPRAAVAGTTRRAYRVRCILRVTVTRRPLRMPFAGRIHRVRRDRCSCCFLEGRDRDVPDSTSPGTRVYVP